MSATSLATAEHSSTTLTARLSSTTGLSSVGLAPARLPTCWLAAAQHPAVFPHIRIEACDTCRRYLLSIDLTTDPAAVPLVDEMSAIPLDLYAREQGFSKITTNLMGF